MVVGGAEEVPVGAGSDVARILSWLKIEIMKGIHILYVCYLSMNTLDVLQQVPSIC